MADLAYTQVVEEQDEENLEEVVDYFDLLPDPIVVVIFNKVFDAKSLCSCSAVSKRFASLVPEVESICIKMNPPKLKQPNEDSSKTKTGSKNLFKNFVSKFLTKPLNFLQQVILNGKNKANSSTGFGSGIDILNWVGVALKNFNDVKSIKLELPCYGGEIGINKSIPLLKWEAGFGKEMERCVILGATSVVVQKKNNGKKKLESCSCDDSVVVVDNNTNNNNTDNEELLFSDEELRLRIIWIISCLIASSGRHNLMKKMVGQCPKLSNAVISDAGRQGKLQMNSEQIKGLRDSIDSTTDTNKSDDKATPEAGIAPASVGVASSSSSSTSQMGYVGNLVMKLWYVKELELPSSGKVMKGATLVVIKPEIKVGGEEKGKESDGLNLWGSFEGDEVFEEAARELFKRKEKRAYRLEMNAF